MKRINRLIYDMREDQWELHGLLDRPIPVYCGQRFSIQIAGQYLSCRLEQDTDWYVIFHDACFHLHPHKIYNVKIS